MSPDLIAFLKAWHDWATSGAPDGETFFRGVGLCGNSSASNGEVCVELLDIFEDDYPFGYREYVGQQISKTMHECPRRLAWVRERLVEAGVLVS